MGLTAVILAAGLGQRLGDLTADRPKALVEVEGRPLLELAILALGAAGVEDVAVVTGHRSSAIEAFVRGYGGGVRVRTIHNPAYATTNNIVSFLAAAEVVEQGCLLLNADVVFDPGIAADLVAAPPGAWLVVDQDEPLGAEEMKVELDDEGRLRAISKGLDPGVAAGEYIGLARLDGDAGRRTLDAARALVGEGQTGVYYEDAFARAAPTVPFRIRPTAQRAWTEIDDLVDYERARRVVRSLALAGGPA